MRAGRAPRAALVLLVPLVLGRLDRPLALVPPLFARKLRGRLMRLVLGPRRAPGVRRRGGGSGESGRVRLP